MAGTKKIKHPILLTLGVVFIFHSVLKNNNDASSNKHDAVSITSSDSSQPEAKTEEVYSPTCEETVYAKPETYVEDSLWDTGTITTSSERSYSDETIDSQNENSSSYVSASYWDANPYTAIEKAIQEMASQITIEDDAYTLTWADVGTMPYGSFWIKSITSSHYTENGHDYNTYYFEYYNVSSDDIIEMKAQIDERYQEIVSYIPEDADTFETARIVHDILVSEISYDHTLTQDYRTSVYGGLVRGQAVCCGYATTYCFILNRLGIPCQIIQNDDHSFNKIGSTYVDVTWDDDDCIDENGNAVIRYTYFGMSLDTVNSIPAHEVAYVSYNEGSDAYILPSYFEYYGYELSYYDYNAIVNIFREQYSTGNLFPSVHFANSDAYYEFAEKINTDIWSILPDIGYSGEYIVFYPDEENLTWRLGLSPVISLD
ncbi:MAG: hypothetical protein IK020_05340 [Clostridiales bacterium]|nr:hypothetical protein [Clostridiales bacterium]